VQATIRSGYAVRLEPLLHEVSDRCDAEAARY